MRFNSDVSAPLREFYRVLRFDRLRAYDPPHPIADFRSCRPYSAALNRAQIGRCPMRALPARCDGPRVDGLEVGRGKDAVEFCDRAAAVKAVAGIDQPVALAEIMQAAAGRAPFVAVAHQDCRQFLAFGDMVQDRARLMAAAQPRNVEMHPDDAQSGVTNADCRRDRAARFERRQVERMAFLDLGALANEQRIAVPADAVRAIIERDRNIIAVLVQHMRRDRAGAGAETAVGFLQRDDVGVRAASTASTRPGSRRRSSRMPLRIL